MKAWLLHGAAALAVGLGLVIVSSPASSPSWGPGQSSLFCWRGINPILRGGMAFLPSASSLSKALLSGCCYVPPSTPPTAGQFPNFHVSWCICCDFLHAGSSGLPCCCGLLPQRLWWAPGVVLLQDGLQCPDLSPGPAWDSWLVLAPSPTPCSCSTVHDGCWCPGCPAVPKSQLARPSLQ